MRSGLRPTTALALVALSLAAATAQASMPPNAPAAAPEPMPPVSSVTAADRTLERTRAPRPHPEVAVTESHAPAMVVTPIAFVGRGIPANLLDAYRAAEATLARAQPACGLRWYHLAGIGRIESGHARGGQALANGDTSPRIMGPALTGGPFAAIPDSDNGTLDGDTVWDRAVGPMQFIPTTWTAYRTDGNGDGTSSPHNIYDAATAAGRYLCSGGLNLANPSDLDAAIFRYNHSREYVSTVMTWMHQYSEGATPQPPTAPGPDLPPPPPPDVDPIPLPEPIPVPDPKPPVIEPVPPVVEPPVEVVEPPVEPTPEPPLLACADLIDGLPILGDTDLLCVEEATDAATGKLVHRVRPVKLAARPDRAPPRRTPVSPERLRHLTQ
ncbi:putative secreted protein [Alloactinosynnema sp. L-07]|uniref:lytic transglycosylase domain-containing protein n=1 Tax=Alloactinosynnema sp. L-07 TaxID=1653480 RepID=UPI00065EFC21|nr:hypothetical protein [Alloactinosynnema sp. L-07]CRK59172.1 putative secreted protein [Alloactinosynnema sp. L-07]